MAVTVRFVDPPKRGEHERNDAGIKSEGEEDSQSGGGATKCKATLGRTPNHLTLRYPVIAHSFLLNRRFIAHRVQKVKVKLSRAQ